MKETRTEIEAKLLESRRRLGELEERGAEALSHYDRTIAFRDDETALRDSKWLVSNHIAYYSRQLAEMPPEQAKLF